jgi:hypothetical protein
MRLQAISLANSEDTQAIENLLAGRPELAEADASAVAVESSGGGALEQDAGERITTATRAHAQDRGDAVSVALLVGLIVLGVATYMAPSIIAFGRGHRFKWPIAAFNIGAGWSGIGWIWTLVWAVWPHRSTLIEPMVGDATGIDARQR